jgi:alkylhydroperoxidase family enzyme
MRSTHTTSPRIAPVEPPYEPEIADLLAKWMPPGQDVEPLKLFRTLAVHPGLASRMRPLGSAILAKGILPAREREIVLHRTCARAGAGYEWGVHAVAFAPAVGLSEEQIVATAHGDADDPAWSDERDRLLVRLADELYDTATLSDELYERIAAEWSEAELLELVAVAGFYRLISTIVNVARVEPEPWARAM